MQLHKPRNNTKRSKRITKEEKQAYAECVQDMPRCMFPNCGTTIGLEIHHLKHGYGKRVTEKGNLIRLCYHHHRTGKYAVHKNAKKWTPILQDIVAKLYGGK